MVGLLWRMWKCCDLLYDYKHLPGGTLDKYENPRDTRYSGQTRSRDLPNANQSVFASGFPQIETAQL
jgi:hypothetical protein